MVHVPAKFQENSNTCYSAKIKRERTDRQTDGRCVSIFPCPGPSARREIINTQRWACTSTTSWTFVYTSEILHLGKTLEIPIGVGGVGPTAGLPTPTS